MAEWVGEKLNGQSLGKLDWNRVEFVVVSGGKVNPCGHALLHVGGGFGHYFHVPGIPRWYETPFHISGSDYHRYLVSSGKREIGRKPISIPCPQAAERKLLSLMTAKWAYGVVPNNCVSFIQSIARAGGNYWDFSNCPQTEPLKWKWLEEKVTPLFQVTAASCPAGPPS